MSDFSNSYGFKPTNFGNSSFGSGFQRPEFSGFGTGVKPLTQAQQELQPYIRQEKINEEEKKKKIRPLAMIFDLLSRGQYASANLVDEVIQSLSDDDPWTQDLKEIAIATIDGITGKKKGSFRDVLANRTNLDDVTLWTRKDKMDKEGNVVAKGNDRFLGQVDMADVLGFAGDVVLDPLNLVTFGGTKAAKAAAKAFANDSVKMALKSFGVDLAQNSGDDLVRFASRTFDKAKYNALRKESLEKASNYFTKHMGNDMSRGLNETWKKAYEKALVSTPEALRSEMGQGIAKVNEARAVKDQGIIDKLFKQNLAGKLDTPSYMAQKAEVLEKPSVLADLEKDLFQSYSGAGETRLFNILGKDFGVSPDRAQYVQRGWNVLKEKIGDNPVGKTLSDAWWSVMNNGAVGQLRKALGFRNPYEKLIRQTELQKGMASYQQAIRDNVTRVNEAIGAADDDLMNKYVRAIDIAEAKNTKKVREAGGYNVFDAIRDPEVQAKLGVTPEQVQPLEELAGRVGGLMRTWRNEYNNFAPYVREAGLIENYLPVGRVKASTRKGAKSKVGSSTPEYSLRRSYTRAATEAQEKAKIKWLLQGTDATKADVDTMVEQLNLGGVEMDLKSLLFARAQGHAEATKRFNLMEALKEFGINVREISDNPKLKSALTRPGAHMGELGLQEIGTKGFEGMMFDKTVADVFGRITKSMSEQHLPALRKTMKSYMNWWKGIVTMTTGFHARNWVSNNTTGFMEHGAKWFDPSKANDAMAVSIYALRRNNMKQAAEELGFTNTWLNKTLAKEISPGRTLKDAADDLLRDGLISDAQMGFNPKTAQELMSKAKSGNPFSQDFVGLKGSRKLGSIIENEAKVRSYLIGYDEILKKIDNPKLAAEAHDFAQMEAKKWFIDYEDMTTFEQNVMKNVIPFYSWMRRNLGNQIEGILVYPQMYSLFPKIKEAIRLDDEGFDESLVQEWMEDQGMFPVAKSGDETLMFRPDMPFLGLNMLPLSFIEGRILPQFDFKELKEEFANSANPMIKQIASGLTEKGYDFFRKKELDETAKAPYAVQLLVQEPKTVEWLDNAIKWAGGEGLKAKVENGKLEMNAKYMQIIDNFVPLLKQVNYLLYTGTSVIPQLQQAIEESTGIEDDYEKLEQILQLTSYYTGIKNYTMNEEERRFQQAQGIYSSAREARNADLAKDPERARRNLEARENQNDLIRRLVY